METKDDKILFTAFLPWPPTVNDYWVRTRAGMKRTKRAKEYIKSVEQIMLEQSLPYEIYYRLTMILRLVPPDKRRRDIDNYIKAVFDSLVYCGVIIDDEQIDELHVIKSEPEPPGRVLLICKRF